MVVDEKLQYEGSEPKVTAIDFSSEDGKLTYRLRKEGGVADPTVYTEIETSDTEKANQFMKDLRIEHGL